MQKSSESFAAVLMRVARCKAQTHVCWALLHGSGCACTATPRDPSSRLAGLLAQALAWWACKGNELIS